MSSTGDEAARKEIRRRMEAIAKNLTPTPSWPSYFWYFVFSIMIIGIPFAVQVIQSDIDAKCLTEFIWNSDTLELAQIGTIPWYCAESTVTQVFGSVLSVTLAIMGANWIGVYRLKRLRDEYFEHQRKLTNTDTSRPYTDEIKGVERINAERQGYLINWCFYTYVAGTVVAAFLWFVFPETSRLEPLTFAYGLGTGLFGFFRSERNIRSPIIDPLKEPD